MSGSVNKVILIGNLGNDPEIHQTKEGKKIVSFSMATTDAWRDKLGQKQTQTEWHKVSIFNDSMADGVIKFLKKGSKVYVEGALKYNEWTDKSGVSRKSSEIHLVGASKIVFLDGTKREEDSQGDAYNQKKYNKDNRVEDTIPW